MMVFTQTGTSATVHRSGGGTESVNVQAGVEINSFRAWASGWVAAGSAPAGDGTRLLLLARAASEVRALAPPVAGRSVREPVLLGVGESLEGLAWIEGNRVHAAARVGSSWAAPSMVAEAAAGTTLGLAGSALADGTWLLLWSASDGEDDEITWSLRSQQGAWSAPSRLAPDNAVPDLTPALYATADGALAAWSRFDGIEYELVLSRFDGHTWSAPRRVAGAGALRPSFLEPAGRVPQWESPERKIFSAGGSRWDTRGAAGAPLLLYRAARPRGWAVVEAAAPFLEIARSTLDRPDRPAVELDEAGARLVWSGRKQD